MPEKNRQRIETKLKGRRGGAVEALAGSRCLIWDIYASELRPMSEWEREKDYLGPRRLAKRLINPWLNPNQVRRVLEVGCGEFMDMFAWADEWSGARIVGVDRQLGRLEAAAKLIEANNLGSRVSLVEGEVCALGEKLGGDFEVIVARHPNVFMNQDNWREVFSVLRNRLGQNGVFLVSCYFAGEFGMLGKLLNQTGWKVRLAGVNEDFGRMEVDQVSDAFVLLAGLD